MTLSRPGLQVVLDSLPWELAYHVTRVSQGQGPITHLSLSLSVATPRFGLTHPRPHWLARMCSGAALNLSTILLIPSSKPRDRWVLVSAKWLWEAGSQYSR